MNITAQNGNAGALAGIAPGSGTIENILVISEANANPYFASQVVANATDKSAGGLIGEANSVTIKNCASTIQVKGYDAGGLVGYAHDSTRIERSYASGHTINGRYDKSNPNVQALHDAGGLVGVLSNSRIEKSYTTASVKAGDTADAGGLVGKMTGGSQINDSYTVSRIYTNGYKGAVVSNYQSGSFTNVYYLEIANKNTLPVRTDAEITLGKADENPASYIETMLSSVAEGEQTAFPYDQTLSQLYKGYYQYETVDFLGGYTELSDTYVVNHYGDWPTYETIMINE